MLDTINKSERFFSVEGELNQKDLSQASIRRFLKTQIYHKLPLGSRAFLYFLYRYIALGGFLDGKAGFIFHTLQGFWYRFLVDVKILEFQTKLKNNQSWKQILRDEHDIDLQ